MFSYRDTTHIKKKKSGINEGQGPRNPRGRIVFFGFAKMSFDYSPAELAPRRSARRSLLLATLCVVSLSAVVSREGVARRHTAVDDVAPPEVAAAFPSPQDSVFDETIQNTVADASVDVPKASEWHTVTVRAGQTLSTIFEAEGLGNSECMEILGLSRDSARLRNLRAGEKLHLLRDAEGSLEELHYDLDETHTLQVRRNDDQLEAFTVAAELERRPAQAVGVIDSSLFAAAQKAGLPNRLTLEFAELFGYDVDFALDLREGDRFVVIYDELYKNGQKVRDGNIVAAEFVNQGRSYRAMRYEDVDGNVAYYSPDGQSLRKAFMRTPVDFARISSGFNLHRLHPILNVIRAHKGVDYAATIGTPVKATGDGRVEFVGNKGGYGHVIMLKHGAQYETVYGHLSRFRAGLAVGQKVTRGQVIGYVGMSGLATAPHLHYEFRINGVHQNPVTVTLPRANPLPRSVVAQWRTANGATLAQLDTLSQTRTARAGTTAASFDTR
jgi:murein DD-endopeptidase MepM/ murein hydrolase activator NlpD